MRSGTHLDPGKRSNEPPTESYINPVGSKDDRGTRPCEGDEGEHETRETVIRETEHERIGRTRGRGDRYVHIEHRPWRKG